jgi:hypothetical protein
MLRSLTTRTDTDLRAPLSGSVVRDLDDSRSRTRAEDDLDDLLAFPATRRRLGQDRDCLAGLP